MSKCIECGGYHERRGDYCSNRCYTKRYNREYQKKVRSGERQLHQTYTKVCSICGDEFTTNRSSRKICEKRSCAIKRANSYKNGASYCKKPMNDENIQQENYVKPISCTLSDKIIYAKSIGKTAIELQVEESKNMFAKVDVEGILNEIRSKA